MFFFCYFLQVEVHRKKITVKVNIKKLKMEANMYRYIFSVLVRMLVKSVLRASLFSSYEHGMFASECLLLRW